MIYLKFALLIWLLLSNTILNANCVSCNFDNKNLANFEFKNQNLSNASFKGAYLVNADFSTFLCEASISPLR